MKHLETNFNDFMHHEPVVRIAKEFFDDDIEDALNMVFEKGCDYYIESL